MRVGLGSDENHRSASLLRLFSSTSSASALGCASSSQLPSCSHMHIYITYTRRTSYHVLYIRGLDWTPTSTAIPYKVCCAVAVRPYLQLPSYTFWLRRDLLTAPVSLPDFSSKTSSMALPGRESKRYCLSMNKVSPALWNPKYVPNCTLNTQFEPRIKHDWSIAHAYCLIGDI